MPAHCRLSCAVVARLAECSMRALLGEGGHELGLSAEAISAIHTLDADLDADLDANHHADCHADLDADPDADNSAIGSADHGSP